MEDKLKILCIVISFILGVVVYDSMLDAIQCPHIQMKGPIMILGGCVFGSITFLLIAVIEDLRYFLNKK